MEKGKYRGIKGKRNKSGRQNNFEGELNFDPSYCVVVSIGHLTGHLPREENMRRLYVICALAAFALLGSNSMGMTQTIKIGAVVPLTGRYAGLGAQVRAGYEIGVEQINAAGGVSVGGKKMRLELSMLDDESGPTKTVARLETLATQGVVVYLGGAGSDLHAAAASIAAQNKIPFRGSAVRF